MKKKQDNIICLADWKKRLEVSDAQKETENLNNETALNNRETFLPETAAENHAIEDDDYLSGMLIW